MNYKSLLYEIQDAAQSTSTPDTIIIPSNKQLYNIDLNTRVIDGPETLSVQSDHYSDTVYFLVDRFYDSMDLATTNCVVQYVSGEDSYVYAVPFCDITTFEGKMIIPWSISESATKNSGNVKYFLRFYLIDEASVRDDQENYDPSGAQFKYSLSTLVATSQILRTMSQEDFIREDETLELPERYFELVNIFSKLVDNSTVYWIDV